MAQQLAEWFGRRTAVAELENSSAAVIAGLVRFEDGTWVLCESSGQWPIPESLSRELTPQTTYWAVIAGVPAQPAWVYRSEKSPQPSMQHLLSNRKVHQQRWLIHSQIEAFFNAHYFIKADTPVWVTNPGMEPYLDTFAVGEGWLRTSPELHLKQLLAAGHDRLFQIAPCFRAGDRGRWHREEFLMLEWYRLFAGLEDLIADIQGLLQHLAAYSADPDYWQQPLEVISVVDLFQRELGLKLQNCDDVLPLQQALQSRGFNSFDENDDWDTLFHLAFLNFIEPKLGADRPVIVRDYPASQAALARLAPSQAGVMPHCLRFELFAKGIELANAFDELTDADEQRRRHEADRVYRRENGKPVYPHDETFLAALASGLPPAAGIALGVDRLVALLLGMDHLDAILPFKAIS